MTDPLEPAKTPGYSPKTDGMRRGATFTPLRILLAVVVLSTIPFAFLQGEEMSTVWVLSNYVGPALVIMFTWGVLLDMLMVVVFRAGRQPEDRRPYRNALLFDSCLLVALIYAWGPFYMKLLSS